MASVTGTVNVGEVTLRRHGLVLGWVTAGIPSWYFPNSFLICMRWQLTASFSFRSQLKTYMFARHLQPLRCPCLYTFNRSFARYKFVTYLLTR